MSNFTELTADFIEETRGKMMKSTQRTVTEEFKGSPRVTTQTTAAGTSKRLTIDVPQEPGIEYSSKYEHPRKITTSLTESDDSDGMPE